MFYNGGHGAHATISGFISNGALWHEQIAIEINGVPATGLTDEIWYLGFRQCEGAAAEATLSSEDGKLTYEETPELSVLTIRVPTGGVKALDGDYVTDLWSKSLAGEITHWAHGMVTFNDDPTS